MRKDPAGRLDPKGALRRCVAHKLSNPLPNFTASFPCGDFPGGSDSKASAYNERDPGSIPGLERSFGEGNGNPLQYSCLENPMDGEVWQATVHGVAKSRTRLSDFVFTFSLREDEDLSPPGRQRMGL